MCLIRNGSMSIRPFLMRLISPICYVAVENMLPERRTEKLRWLLTFFFGLVHGLGFAGAIEEIGSPGSFFWARSFHSM